MSSLLRSIPVVLIAFFAAVSVSELVFGVVCPGYMPFWIRFACTGAVSCVFAIVMTALLKGPLTPRKVTWSSTLIVVLVVWAVLTPLSTPASEDDRAAYTVRMMSRIARTGLQSEELALGFSSGRDGWGNPIVSRVVGDSHYVVSYGQCGWPDLHSFDQYQAEVTSSPCDDIVMIDGTLIRGPGAFLEPIGIGARYQDPRFQELRNDE